MGITHAKVSAKADGGDSSLILPSDWNAPHVGPWFNVLDYGAVGDGATDDLTEANAAIAALNAAGGGVLYWPAVPVGDYYYISAGMTAITVPCLILGDGGGAIPATVIATDHATANLFTLSHQSSRVSGMRIVNYGGTESAGAAIAVTTGDGSHNRYDHLWVEGFYDGMALLYGGEWSMSDCHITNPVRYGVRIANVDIPDGGDWAMTDVWFGTRSRNATAAIRQESAGGGKMVNVKINQNSAADQTTFSGVFRYVTGHHVYIDGSANNTTVMSTGGCSIENVSGDAVLIQTNGTGSFGLVALTGLQVGLYGNNAGRAVKVSAATNGTIGTNGSIAGVVITGLVARTDGTARAAIELVNTDRVTLGDIQLIGFNARYTSSGDTNTTDVGPVTSMPAHGCRVKRASGNFSVGNNTLTAIEFTAEDFDTDTMHDNSTNNTRITIPSITGVTTGLWAIHASGYFDKDPADFVVRLGGSTNIFFTRSVATLGAGTFGAPVVSAQYVFTAGDYIELLGRTPGGAGNVAFDDGLSPIFGVAFLGKVT